MKVLFVCKASTETGFGHLMRSRTLALSLHKQRKDSEIKFVTIGRNVSRLLSELPFEVEILEQEEEINVVDGYDLTFVDMVEMGEDLMKILQANSTKVVSLSPIFNRMQQVDALFHRTKYDGFEEGEGPQLVFSGLEYAFVPKSCEKISAGIYEENLNSASFPIAVSMGGGDAANKTLRFLRSLKHCQVPATFWVMLGEGYQHSYDDLIQEIRTDTQHEVILAKTNRSMWQILKNCVLVILPGGVTTYEAAYAGLPSLNFFDSPEREYLVKELVENGACRSLGAISDSNLSRLNEVIEDLHRNRSELLEMHIKAKALIDDNGASRIIAKCEELLEIG